MWNFTVANKINFFYLQKVMSERISNIRVGLFVIRNKSRVQIFPIDE